MAKSRQSRFRRAGLARAREAAGLTQEAFAGLAGVEVSTVVRWESGSTTPLPGKRPRIARALGIGLHDLERLLSPDGSPQPGRIAAGPAWGERDGGGLAVIAAVREEIAGLAAEYEDRPAAGLVLRAARVLARVEGLRGVEVAGGGVGAGAGIVRSGAGEGSAGLAALPGPESGVGGARTTGFHDRGVAVLPAARAGAGSGAGAGVPWPTLAVSAGAPAVPASAPALPAATPAVSAGAPAVPASAPGLTQRWRRDLDIAEAEITVLIGRLLGDAAGRRDPSAAEELFDRAARRAAQAGDSVLQASAILRSAFLGLYGGDPRAGIRRCARAAVIAAPVSRALFALARLHAAEGYALVGDAPECDRALAAARAALANDDADDPAPNACPPRTYQRLSGAAHLALGRYPEARAALTDAAAAHEPGETLAIVLGHLALVHLGEGDPEAALRHLRSAIELAEATRSAAALAVASRAGRALIRSPGGDRAAALEIVDRLLFAGH